MLVTRDPAIESAVAAALNGSQRLESAGVYPGLQDLLNRLERAPAPAVLVDIDPQPGEILRSLEGIAGRFAGTRFVVLSNELRNDLVMEAMQAGARHFVVKQSIASDLAGILQRLLPETVTNTTADNTLIAVLSVSGGCGATTLAVNLANEIQLARKEPVLLVDLDASYGAVADYLDLKGQFGIADVLTSPGRIDAELIRSTAIVQSENLSLLVSPATVNFSKPAPLDFTLLEDTLRACKQAYSFTVIDAPRVSMDVAATLAAACKLTLIVFQLTVKDLRLAKAIGTALAERGVPREKLLGVANRFQKRNQMVGLEDARKALRDISIEAISNDFPSSILGINYGQPLSRAAPRSALRRDFEKLACRFYRNSLGS